MAKCQCGVQQVGVEVARRTEAPCMEDKGGKGLQVSGEGKSQNRWFHFKQPNVAGGSSKTGMKKADWQPAPRAGEGYWDPHVPLGGACESI